MARSHKSTGYSVASRRAAPTSRTINRRRFPDGGRTYGFGVDVSGASCHTATAAATAAAACFMSSVLILLSSWWVGWAGLTVRRIELRPFDVSAGNYCP